MTTLSPADTAALEVARAEETRRRATTKVYDRDGQKIDPDYRLTVDDIVAWQQRKLVAMRRVNPDQAFRFQPDRTPCELTDSIPGLLAAMPADEAAEHLRVLYEASHSGLWDPAPVLALVRVTRRVRWKGNSFLYADNGDYGLLLPEGRVFHMRGAGGFSTAADLTAIETVIDFTEEP